MQLKNWVAEDRRGGVRIQGGRAVHIDGELSFGQVVPACIRHVMIGRGVEGTPPVGERGKSVFADVVVSDGRAIGWAGKFYALDER